MPIVPEDHTHRCLQADQHKRLCTIEADIKLHRAKSSPRYPIEFKSQFGEDALLWSLFEGSLSGFFIEAGAFDGYRYSATYALEAVGWNGLCVEANPIAVEHCRARRQYSKTVNAMLGPIDTPDETGDFTLVRDHHDGMLSYSEHSSDHHRQAVKDGNFETTTVKVPRRSLNSILSEMNPPRIDCLVLDVEGAEDHVLAGFDLNRWKPRVMLIEDGSKSDSDEGRARAIHLFNQGYACMGFLFINGIFVRQDDPVFKRAREVVFP